MGRSPPPGPCLLLLPFSFALPLNLLPSLIRLTMARREPRGLTDVDGAGCAGSVSTPACIECIRVVVGEASLRSFFGLWPVRFRFGRGSIGGGVDGGGGSGCVAGTSFATGVPGSPL